MNDFDIIKCIKKYQVFSNGKLRQEYHGISKPNSYVLDHDWKRMRK